ncbi:hypothetical protein [Halarcobacter sp.]|uniref:hypothetical protein n=1 Tax=Halarcobacter sp. TaxID=2321133 RepID=UPI002AAAB7CB|nr:hypothetical protein [Halarcobacter sp.]
MKYLFLILLVYSFSFSANLLYLEKKENGGIKTYCIDNSYYYRYGYINFYDFSLATNISLPTKNFQKIVIIPGYDFEDSNCFIDESKYLGLSYEQYVFLMSLTGLLCGSLIASIILFKVI